ncbi:MAG: DUF3613 domain-containing protein, partial [Paraperlucidibaca sp.]
KFRTLLALTLAVSVSSLAIAAEATSIDAISADAMIAPGMQANAWLSAQSQGSLASSNPQAAKSIQRNKSAERFMKTYDFPIKESFYGDKFKAGK